ncbi:hypothetical protein ACOMHN_033283 [Nucella lapillus]
MISSLENPVVFSVHYGDDEVVNTTADKGPIVFDAVTFNAGGGNYSNTTGSYTAPADGTYAFFLTVQRIDPYLDSCLQATLMVNGHWTDCAVSACPPGYSTSSNTCMMYLHKGQHVFAQGYTNHQIFGHIHTTFSSLKLV